MGPSGLASQTPPSLPNLTTALGGRDIANRSEGILQATEPPKRADPRLLIEHRID
jgi:hypothetical protein